MHFSTEIHNKMESLSQDAWREHFLQRILVFSAIIGLFALIPAVITTSDLVIQSVYISVFVLLVLAIIIRLPYSVKAATFVLIPLILGFSNITQAGVRGDYLFYFLAFVSFSTLFMGSRVGVASIFISELIIIGMGYLILNEAFLLSDKLAIAGSLTDWVSAAASLLFISLVTLFTLRMLNQRMHIIQEHAIALQQSQQISHNELENRVTEHTLELSHKTNLLNAVSIVTHQTLFLPELDILLNRTVNLISEHFACYQVGIYLINQRGDNITLQAASSETGKRLQERGFRIMVGTKNLIGNVAAEKKPRVLLDIGKDGISFDNPEFTETRAELSLPLLVRNKLIGVLDLQSTEGKAFKYDDVEIFQSMADQIAAAIENARLITKSQFVISQLEILSSKNTRYNWQTESAIRNPIVRYSATGVGPIGKNYSQVQKQGDILDIPIVLRGQKIGKISLKRKDGFQKWTAQEKSIASDVVAQTALALENIRLVARTRERADREQTISNVSARIRETLDLDIILRTSARELQKSLGLQEAEIRLIPQNNLDDEDSNIEATF